MIKTYSELITIPTFEERYEYLRLDGIVGKATFGYDRYLNQILYTSREWRRFRDDIIIRDMGCDLAIPGFEIPVRAIVHHINPITLEDFMNTSDDIFDPENLVCVSFNTHQAIHYGDASLLPELPVERRPNDTCLWRT